jgi:hypothetical protein
MTVRTFLTLALVMAITPFAQAADQWVTYPGGEGPGQGKHIVIVTGDDEYRSEVSMPQMGKILSERHGFKVTVLFAINPKTGAIDPATMDNIPGLELLADADLMVLFLRFRALPDPQMKMIMDYTNSGKPIMAMRTATHPFNYKRGSESPYAKWTWTSEDPKGGYGREILGETWVNHHGDHKVESTRGIPAKGQESNPILNGCEDVWGPSDVYGITTLTGDSQPVLMGQVLKGMNPEDEVNTDKAFMPIAWTKTYTGTSGKASRIFTTTMGHSYDFKNEGVRRLFVNAAYWLVGLENEIPKRANVDYVGTYDPIDIGFGTHTVGVMPSDHALK